MGCGIHVSRLRATVLLVGKYGNETMSFRRYDDDVSLRNLYEVIAEKIYDRRVEDIYISGSEVELIDEALEFLRPFLYPFSISTTDTFSDEKEFFSRLEKTLRTKIRLKTVDTAPEDKIHGSHSTIIGGREGLNLILSLAKSPYVKKIVPGVIEGNATSAGGGVKLKLTRSDDKGNLRALLIDGSSVQQVHVITTASSKEEGETVMRILSGLVHSSQNP
ncbi:DUF2103 domain-containing protein [Archaeoglobus neptunius]|uniref:DUF2103 domain-containing protein n=1 Tax=Archaeoglobus neptunius TaxID=2798580 RepID=UPI001E43F19E|nr:DUF2103 domain-containing protein [Archaeoglobus neptunius]